MTVRDRWSVPLALLWVLGIGSGFALFGFQRLGTPAPLLWVIVLACLSAPLILDRTFLESAVRVGLLPWVVAALVLSGAAFLWSSQSAFAQAELLKRILATAFIFVGASIAHQPAGHRIAALAFGANAVFATALNAIDTAAPMTFSEVFGRAAGLYGNPNVSGMAILCGALLALGYLDTRLRPFLLGIAGLGILLTLSRGVLLSFGVCIVALAASGRISLKGTLTWTAVVASVAALLLLLLIGLDGIQLAYSAIVERGVLDRIADASVTTGGIDYSTNLRADVLVEGLRLFLEHPLLGAGIGATNEWSLGVSTHNTYVKQMAEYGIAGLALYCWLLFMAMRQSRLRRDGGAELVLVIALSVLGLFSHNLLDDWSVLVTWSLLVGTITQRTPTRPLREQPHALNNQKSEGTRVNE